MRGSGCTLSLAGSAGVASSRGATGTTAAGGAKLLAFTSDTDVTVTSHTGMLYGLEFNGM